MSGAAVVGAVTAAVTAGASIYSSRQQSKATKKAADQQAKSSAQQLNRDSSSTMLTGARGVGRDQLTLGGIPSLLGG